MFFLLYFASGLDIRSGYTDISISGGEMIDLNFDLSNFNVLIFSSNNDKSVSISQKYGDKTYTTDHLEYPAIFVENQFITISNNGTKALRILIWAGPSSNCENGGYLAFTHKELGFQIDIEQENQHFCIFNSVSGTSKNEIIFDRNDSSKVWFFTESTLDDPINCGAECEFTTKQSYYYSIDSTINTLTIQAHEKDLAVDMNEKCFVKPIPTLGVTGNITTNSPKVSIHHLTFCFCCCRFSIRSYCYCCYYITNQEV